MLKPPQSKRIRECQASSNRAKRLDCVRFTAVFADTKHYPKKKTPCKPAAHKKLASMAIQSMLSDR